MKSLFGYCRYLGLSFGVAPYAVSKNYDFLRMGLIMLSLLLGSVGGPRSTGQIILTTTTTLQVPANAEELSIVVIGSGGNGGDKCFGGACGNGGGGGGGGLAYLTFPVENRDMLEVINTSGNFTIRLNGLVILTANRGSKGVNDKTGGKGGVASINSDVGIGAAFAGGKGGSTSGYGRGGWGGGAGEYYSDGLNAPYYDDSRPPESLRPKGVSIIGPDSTENLRGLGGNGGQTVNNGAVRIIWGEGRYYPDSNTEDA